MTQSIERIVSRGHNRGDRLRPGSMSALRKSDAAVLTLAEVAALFGVDARTVSRAAHDGDLPCIRLGKRVFIPRERFLALIDGSPVADEPPAIV